MKLYYLFSCVAVLTLCMIGSAHAQTVNLSPLIDYGLDTLAALGFTFVSTGIAVVSGFLARKLKISADIQRDERAEHLVRSAIMNGVDYAKRELKDKNLDKITFKSKFLALVANYVITKVPDALKRVGIANKSGFVDQEGIHQRAIAYSYGELFDTNDTPMGFHAPKGG